MVPEVLVAPSIDSTTFDLLKSDASQLATGDVVQIEFCVVARPSHLCARARRDVDLCPLRIIRLLGSW